MPSSTLTSTKLSVRDVSCSLLRVNGNDIDTNFDVDTFIANLDLSNNVGLAGVTIAEFARVIDSDYVDSTYITGNTLTLTLSDDNIDTKNYASITTGMSTGSNGDLNLSEAPDSGVAVGLESDGNLYNTKVRLLGTSTSYDGNIIMINRPSDDWADSWNSHKIGFRCMQNGNEADDWDGYIYCRGYQYRNHATTPVSADLRGWHICCDLVIQAQQKATHVTRFSDRRLKKNIVPIKNAMESINKLNIVHYIKTHPAGGRKKEIGVIAQEVEATNDLNLIRSVRPPMTKDDYYNVEYAQLHYIAIKALQELHDEYEKFKEEKNKKLLHLMERITALENKKNIKY